MRLVEGDTLDKAIASARTSTQRLALVPGIRRACEAVAYAHENAIVHRDLKPSNILIGPFGETVVLDWGLAKALEDDEVDGDSVLTTLADGDGMTRPGAVMGTVGYIAPEVAQGEAAGPRSDVFSLGSVLAKLLPPRDGDRTEADNDLAAIVSRATAAAAHTPTRSARCGEMRRGACLATARGEQSAALMDLRMRCLDRSTVELSAAVDVLTRTDASVFANAEDLVGALAPVERCADADAVRAGRAMPTEAEAPTVEVAQAALARGGALRRATHYTEARDSIDHARATLDRSKLIAILAKPGGDSSTGLGVTRGDFAELLWKQDKGVEAEVEFRAALELLAVDTGGSHPQIPRLHGSLAMLLAATERATEAVPFAEAAWEAHSAEAIAPEERARTAFILARVLWEIDPAANETRVLELIEDARTSYARAKPPRTASLEELEHWVRER